MNRSWLIALLLASWTLNVMLGVAYYLKSHYPAGGYWMAETLRPHHPLPRDEAFDIAREAFQEKIEPVIERRQQVFMDIADLFTGDTIDSVEFSRLSDSLDIINSEFQRSQLSHLKEMQCRIPPERRQRMASRLIGRLDRPQGNQNPRNRLRRFRGMCR